MGSDSAFSEPFYKVERKKENSMNNNGIKMAAAIQNLMSIFAIVPYEIKDDVFIVGDQTISIAGDRLIAENVGAKTMISLDSVDKTAARYSKNIVTIEFLNISLKTIAVIAINLSQSQELDMEEVETYVKFNRGHYDTKLYSAAPGKD